MRRSAVLIAACIIAVGGMFAQNKQLLYGLDEVPQSLLLNPGTQVEFSKHLGIPFLSHIHINGGSSGVSVHDIFGDRGGTINDRIQSAIFGMKDSDFFTLNQQFELLSLGWRSRKDIYFSAGIYQEFDFIFYFPRDLAILAWEGNRDYLDYPFDLGQVAGRADLLTVYHFGANRKLGKKLTVGARVKIYSSMLSAHSTDNRGTFTTSFSSGTAGNIYQHRINDAEMALYTSGLASLDGLDGQEVASRVLGRAFFGGSLGLGLDIGATYQINDRLSASASLLDMGAIIHSGDPETYRASGDYNLDGIELLFPPLSDGDTAIPYYDNLEDQIEEAIPIDTLNNSYTQWRPLKVNASLDYGFGRLAGGSAVCDCRNMDAGVRWRQRVGIQLYGVSRPEAPQFAGTLYYYRRLWSFLAAKLTYTADSFSYTNLGLGVVVDTGKFNIYLTGDNLLRYGNLAKAKNVSLQLGVNLKIDR